MGGRHDSAVEASRTKGDGIMRAGDPHDGAWVAMGAWDRCMVALIVLATWGCDSEMGGQLTGEPCPEAEVNQYRCAQESDDACGDEDATIDLSSTCSDESHWLVYRCTSTPDGPKYVRVTQCRGQNICSTRLGGLDYSCDPP